MPPVQEETALGNTRVVKKRVVAFLIDQIFAIFVVLWVPMLAFSGTQFETIGGLVALVALLGYHYLLEGVWSGYTVGKRLVGIRVVQENGSECTLFSSFLRNFLRIVDAIPGFYLVGLFVMFSSETRQRVGDAWANTIVVEC